MKNNLSTYIRIGAIMLVGLLLVGVRSPVQARQKGRIELIHADSTGYQVVNGKELTFLVRPRFLRGNQRLEADSAYDEGDGFFRFRGNVLIVEDDDSVHADFIRYNDDTGIGDAEGNVVLSDGEVVVRAPFATFFSEEKRATFDRGVTFADSASVLTALRGTYFTEDERALFAGDVFLEQDRATVWADSLVFERKTGESEAIGRVMAAQEDENGTGGRTMFADRLLRYGEVDSTRALGHVLIAQYRISREDSSVVQAGQSSPGSPVDEGRATAADTTFLSSGLVTITGGAGRDRVVATDSVVVSDDDFAVRADSLVSDSTPEGREESRFFGRPMSWLRDTQIVADSLFTRGMEGRVDSVLGFSDVFVASFDSSSNRIQQLRGRRLEGHLVGDTLRTLNMVSNAESIYYTRQDDEGALSAAQVSSDTVRFSFVGGEIKRIGYYGQPQGKRYSENLFDRLSDLKGYIWAPERRPNRPEILDLFLKLTSERNRERTAQETVDEPKQPWR